MCVCEQDEWFSGHLLAEEFFVQLPKIGHVDIYNSSTRYSRSCLYTSCLVQFQCLINIVVPYSFKN